MAKRGWVTAACTVVVVTAGACNGGAAGESRADAEPGGDWVVASPEDHGMDPDVTGMPADEYARQKLFEPIGMEETEWWRDAFPAQGFDVQSIWVIPSLDLVVVRSGAYLKDPGPPVADPTLFAHYSSSAAGDGRGTLGPEQHWHDDELLGPIIRSLGV